MGVWTEEGFREAWTEKRFEEGVRVRRFFDGMGYSHRVLYDHGVMRVKENARLTMMIRSTSMKEFTELLRCEFMGAELPSAFHFHTQFVAFNPYAVDEASRYADPEERGNALFHYIARDIRESQSGGMCRDLARYFVMHARVMDNYPSALPCGMNGSDVWDKCFLQCARQWDDKASNLVEAKNIVAKLVREMYPAFVRQRATDFSMLEVSLRQYIRLYWRGNAPREFHPTILLYPRFWGVSPKVFDEINGMASHAVDPFIPLSMARIFGKSWRYYVCRYARDAEVKRAILNTSRFTTHKSDDRTCWGADGPVGLDGLENGVAVAIHDAGYWLPDLCLTMPEGRRLASYLMKYDVARNRPHVRMVARTWSSLTEEQKSMEPRALTCAIVARLEARMREIMSSAPPCLAAEMKKWMPMPAQEDEKSLEDWGDNIARKVTDVFSAAVTTPLPAWTDFSVSVGDYSARWLPRDDPRGMFIGHYTDCCQYVAGGGIATNCAIHSCTSPHGALLVIEKNGKIVGQSWVWQGRDGRACFDNVEVLRKERDPAAFESIIRNVTEQLPHALVTAGVGHTHAPFAGLKKHRDGALYLPVDYPEDGYTDAKTYVVLKGG